MINATSASQGAGNLFNDGKRSWNSGLSEIEKARLRSIEQGSGANLAPFGASDPNSMTRQQFSNYGQANPSSNGMVGNGGQRGAVNQAFSAPVQSQVQPEVGVFGGSSPPNPSAASGMSPTASAIQANPSALEQYWQDNPGTLEQAMQDNPGAWTGFGSSGDTDGSPAGVSGGNYDSYINKAFTHAMRTLDPAIQQGEDRFNQSMIDKGFAADSEGYQKTFDNNSRRYNDLINSAAFNAMGFGANRLDADRGYGLKRDALDYSMSDGDRKFGLNELLTIDNMNRAWDQIGFRNAGFNTSREDQAFNQMLSLFGMTPVGSTVPFNAGAAAGNSANSQFGALNANNQLWGQAAQGITDAIGGIDWGAIFGGSGAQK